MKWLGRALASEKIADGRGAPGMKGAGCHRVAGLPGTPAASCTKGARHGFLPGARDSFLLSGFVFLPRKDLPLAILTLGLPKPPSSSPVNKPEVWSRREARAPGLAHS